MIFPVLLLLCLSITVIYTSNHVLAAQQTLFSLIGIVLYFALGAFDYRVLKSFSKIFYWIVLLSLIMVFILGDETRGSVRWISLGFFNLQPSELAKVSLVISLAHFWSARQTTWKNIFLSVVILTPFILLIFKQPDLGTALTVGFIWLAVLISVNTSVIKMGLITLGSLILTPLAWVFLKDYQRTRLFSFLYPTQDPLGVGYNVIQSTIAVGSGELFGRGLGRGTQSRLQFLPEFRTDFIFAFIAEELGFLGSLIVITLYSIIFILLFRLLFRTKDKFGELIIVGVAAMLFFQTSINIGMNIGIMPITGITLPLLSYGGSSVITILLSLGIVESINRNAAVKGGRLTPTFFEGTI